MKLSVLIPVYNEEKTLNQLIDKVKKVKLVSSLKKEIVVVDDGSEDRSYQILKNIKGIKLIKHPRNMGKGAAVKTAIKKATGDLLIIQDADLEYDPSDFNKLIAPILQRKSKIVYGSRLSREKLILFGSNKTPLPTHFIANKILSFVTNLIYGSNITDMETCYKLFSKEALDGVDIHSKGFSIEPEITAKVLKKGHKIYEVPIKTIPRGYKEGKKITWKDGFGAIWTLIKYRFVN